MAAADITPFIEAGELDRLKGRQVYLEFLAPAHREILRPLARDERIWEFTKTLLITETYDRQFDEYFDQALAFAIKGDQAFAIVATDGRVKEGVLRRFALRNDGSSTDAVIFSILDDEWPANKLRLQEMVASPG